MLLHGCSSVLADEQWDGTRIGDRILLLYNDYFKKKKLCKMFSIKCYFCYGAGDTQGNLDINLHFKNKMSGVFVLWVNRNNGIVGNFSISCFNSTLLKFYNLLQRHNLGDFNFTP